MKRDLNFFAATQEMAPKRKKPGESATEANEEAEAAKSSCKKIVPDDVAAILTTEDEQKLYRLIMQTTKAAQYCRFNYKVTTRIINSVKEVRQIAKSNEEFWSDHIKSSDFLSKSVPERIKKMDEDMWNFCLFLRPLYDYGVSQGSVLQNVELILDHFIDCMVPGKEHIVENIFEEVSPQIQESTRSAEEGPAQDVQEATTEENTKPVKRRRRSFLTMQSQDAHEKKLRKQSRQRQKKRPGRESLQNEIILPKTITSVLSTEDEQKVYKVFVKTCEMCKYLNFKAANTFHNKLTRTYSTEVYENRKEFVSAMFTRMRGRIISKEYKFSAADGRWISYKEATTPEKRIDDICYASDEIYQQLGICDFKTKEILTDYEGFNEKFAKIIEECTSDEA
jgi:hypothetical protein